VSNFFGTHPERIVALLKERRVAGYVPGSDRTRKLALVVEGGGMRGVLSAGSLLAIDLLGYRNCFDAVYATSAGGVNSAYFISGQGMLGITVYFDCIASRRFINFFRVGKIVNVDFVYDEVVPYHKPLDEAAIRSSPCEFFLSATRADNGKNELIDARRARDSVARILKASSAMPILYNRTVRLESGDYVDGGATDALPLQQAINASCTDALVLTTKVRHHVSVKPTFLQAAFAYAVFGWRYPSMLKECLRAHETANHNRRLAVGEDAVAGVSIATLCPQDAGMIVGRTTIDRRKLIEGARQAARMACRALNDDPAIVEAAFEQFRHGSECRPAGQ
jgi:predicted patatin/cPLA2 family phospholipase